MSTKNTTYNLRCSKRPPFSCKQSLTVLLKFYCIVSSCIPSTKSRENLNVRTEQVKAQILLDRLPVSKTADQTLLYGVGRMWWCTILHELSLNGCEFSRARKYSLRIFVIPHLLNIVSSVNGIFTRKLRWTTKFIDR